jgi:hypothetical protein
MQNTLQHVGVLGMHWGRRKSESSSSSSSSDHVKAHSIKKKQLHEMSNEEIRTLTTRMQLEHQYKSLQPKKVATGKKIASATLGNFGKQAVGFVITAAAVGTGKYIVDRAIEFKPLVTYLVKR